MNFWQHDSDAYSCSGIATQFRQWVRARSCVVTVTLLLLSGCNGKAHRDLYQAKMASQIRVLEDQLYDADYQNRVLRDELERAGRSRACDSPSSTPSRSSLLQSISGNSALRNPIVADPPKSSLPVPQPVEDLSSDDAGAESNAAPLIDPEPSKGQLPEPSKLDSTPKQIDPLQPPSQKDIDEAAIEAGEQLPPDSPKDDSPSKIEMPPGSKVLEYERPEIEPIPVPDHLELHDGLSGGHQFDSDNEIDGLYLIVTVQDKNGRILSLRDFDVDAELSVVVLDPNGESEETRIGRWDFNPDEVRKFIRQSPIDGIHVPIAWKEREPSGDDVIVHIRMAAAEEEMRCEGRLKLEESVAISNWLPRG